MTDNENCFPLPPPRVPWNKGKLIGAKPPLEAKHVWSIYEPADRRSSSRPGAVQPGHR